MKFEEILKLVQDQFDDMLTISIPWIQKKHKISFDMAKRIYEALEC